MSATNIEDRDNSFLENKAIDHIEEIENVKGSQEPPNLPGFGGHLIVSLYLYLYFTWTCKTGVNTCSLG